MEGGGSEDAPSWRSRTLNELVPDEGIFKGDYGRLSLEKFVSLKAFDGTEFLDRCFAVTDFARDDVVGTILSTITSSKDGVYPSAVPHRQCCACSS